MAVTTENGWLQCNRDSIITPLVPGTNGVRPEVRAGVCATVLVAWCAWWHENIYPIDTYKPRDYWGWSATNEVWNSNHLSGTAVDLNATRLPWQRYVLPKALRDKINNVGIPLFEGTIYWGGNWGRVDEMHSQINIPQTRQGVLLDFVRRRIGADGRIDSGGADQATWEAIAAEVFGTN